MFHSLRLSDIFFPYYLNAYLSPKMYLGQRFLHSFWHFMIINRFIQNMFELILGVKFQKLTFLGFHLLFWDKRRIQLWNYQEKNILKKINVENVRMF